MSLIMSKTKSSEIHVSKSNNKSNDCEKLLGIKINSKLHLRLSCLRSM